MPSIMPFDPILDLAEPQALNDPGPAYARLRESHPVFWHDDLQTLLVSRYAEAAAVLRDSARYGSDFRRAGEELPPAAISIQTLDPPEHTGIRHLLVDAFRRVDWTALERKIDHAVRIRLADLAQRPHCEFVTEFAEPLAWSTILDVLGVTGPELSWFKPVADAIVDGMDAGIWPELGEPAMAARAEISRLTDGWLGDPDGPAGGSAGSPPLASTANDRHGDGIVAFAAAHAKRRGVTRTVLDNTLRVLVHAGFTSASKILSLGVATLLGQPGALAQVATGDLSLAAEELIRYESPVRALARVCVGESELAGHRLRTSDVVTVLVGAANRDPARFANPDRLWLGRSPNPHLGFGRGAHSCLGTHLAALQARVVFGTLARSYPRAHLIAPPAFRRNLTLRGVAAVTVALR